MKKDMTNKVRKMLTYCFDETKCRVKVAFISSIIIGLITHMYYITNNFANADTNLYAGMHLQGYDWMLSIGRWLSYPFDSLSSFFILPWISGLLAIVLLGACATLVVDMFDIRTRIYIILVSGTLVSFPGIMANFGYINYADTFMYSYLFAILAIYAVNKYNNKIAIVIASVILACSMGIYQSFICVSVLLCLLILMKDLMNSRIQVKPLIFKAIKFLITGVGGTILYFIIWKLILYIRGIQAANYKGLTDYGNYSLKSVIHNIIDSYKYVIKSYYTNEIYYNPLYKRLSYFVLLAVFTLSIIILIKKKEIAKSKIKLLLLISILSILPLGYGFINVIAPASSISPLTVEQLSFYIIMCVIILEQIKEYKIWRVIKYIATFCSFIIIYSNILICNVGYLNLELQNQKAYAQMNRIMDYVLECDDYRLDSPIFIAGDIKGINNVTTVPNQQNYLRGLELVACDTSVYNTMFAKESYIRTYLGIYIQFPSDEVQNEILNSEEYKSMKVFPSKESVKTINGVIVVKMNE